MNKFNVMKGLNITQIKDKLKLLGLITNEGKPISYSGFKNKASVHRYGQKNIKLCLLVFLKLIYLDFIQCIIPIS